MDAPAPPAPRRELRPPLRVETLREEADRPRFLGYAGDLSETGLFVQCTNPRPEGTRLRVRLHLPESGGDTVEAEVEVRWQRGYAGKLGPSAGMGLALVELSDAARKALHALIHR